MEPLRLALLATALPVACVGWGVIEARLYRLRSRRIPVLPEGAPPVRILQVSDLHFRLGARRLAGFVESLASDSYDLVLATGDLLGEPEAVAACAGLLNGLDGRIGRFFVLGSSDYYAPTFKNYFDYFLGRRRHGTRRNPTDDFTGRLVAAGWTDLSNRTLEVSVNGIRTQVTGLDDPYLRREDLSLLVRDPEADLVLCVVHDPAPYSQAAQAGFDLVVGGHTHGGQIRFPFVGAVVTNSTVPRRLARGLHLVDETWLHVNPGLGTGRYAPFRFLCPPEATVLELVPRSGG